MKPYKKNILNDSGSNSPLWVGGSNMFYGAMPILFEFAKKLRDNQTEAEVFLWNHLPIIQIKNLRFKRQHPILYFVADFYCHKAKLIIEVDGGYHNLLEQYEYDKNRDSELEELGLKVLRFTNEEVLFDINTVLKTIEDEIKSRIEYVGN
jgi:very-short-patch-repair endonuclease